MAGTITFEGALAMKSGATLADIGIAEAKHEHQVELRKVLEY